MMDAELDNINHSRERARQAKTRKRVIVTPYGIVEKDFSWRTGFFFWWPITCVDVFQLDGESARIHTRVYWLMMGWSTIEPLVKSEIWPKISKQQKERDPWRKN